jgi:threonine synthase
MHCNGAPACLVTVACRYYARLLGDCIPIRSLVIASNSNAVLPDFFARGSYSLRPAVPTLSPSMDIAVSSNFERFLFDLWDRDAGKTAGKFEELAARKCFRVSPEELTSSRSQFASFSIDNARTIATIRSVFCSSGYLLCPHSAVGFCAAEDFCSNSEGNCAFDGEEVVVLGTAHVGKFVDSITESLDGIGDEALVEALRCCLPKELSCLTECKEQQGKRGIELDNSLQAVQSYMRQHVLFSA